MAFQTAEVLSLDETYDALISFMTANGWSVYDDIPISGSRDKVLWSPGSDGKLNMYYRVSTNTVGNPIKDPADSHVRFPYIFVRGYHNWNPTTHTGSGDFGTFGPVIVGNQNTGLGQLHFAPFMKGDNTVANNLTPTFYQYTYHAHERSTFNFDGRRRMWAGSGAGTGFRDITTPESFISSAGIATTTHSGPIVYRDPNTDKEYVYVITSGTSLLYRFDVDGGVWQPMANPSWSGAALNGCVWLFDGVDFIYLARGNSNTTFVRYSISANTWTSLTALPVALPSHDLGSSQTPNRAVYIPASVTGFSEDVIYMLIADSGTLCYRYDVTSNAWRSTTGTGAINVPSTISATSHLFWDKQRYLYFAQPATAINSYYRADLSTAPGTFTQLGPIDFTTRTFDQLQIFNFIPCKVRGSYVIPMKYFFHGDADSMRVVTRIGTNPANGRYYWSYFGKYDTNYRNAIAGATGAVTAGVRTVIPVDTTTGFNAGQEVMVAQWSGALGGASHFERTTIFEISGSNFICNLTSSFSSGTKIGVDPSQNILTNDSWLGVAPLDALGFRTNYENAWYNIQPALNFSASDRHAPSTRGAYMPIPFMITNEHTASNAKYETLGVLKNVFCLPKRPFPGPQSEDILTIGSQQYIYFNPQEQQRLTVDTRGVVIGPI